MRMRSMGIAASTVLVIVLLAAWGYRLGLWRFNEASREAYPIRGLDVSHHQGTIDWQAVARALGIDPDPVHGGVSEGVTYVVFPGSGRKAPLAPSEMTRRGARLLSSSGLAR